MNKIELICGDCLVEMKKIPDKSIDLVLTSPPYNMGGGKSLGYQPNSKVGQTYYGGFIDKKTDVEYVNWCLVVIKECLRISRYVFWNVQFVRSTRGMIYNLQSQFQSNLKDIFIWQKQAVSSITARGGGMAKGWEYVFMLGENNLSTFSHNDFPKNGYVPNIQTWYKKETDQRDEHHATFPLSLPRYFIQYFTKKNEKVCDPFMGIGSVGIVAKELGRNFIGIEIEPKYFEIAQRRINQTMENLL